MATQEHAQPQAVRPDGVAKGTGVLAAVAQDDVPDERYGAFVQDRTLFAPAA